MKSIAVLGLGKVGRLAAQLLVDSGFDVIGVDSAADANNFPHDVAAIDVTDTDALGDIFSRVEAVLSCLPYHLNIGVSNCRMRVGALPQNPTGLMGYAFNWSPEGVVNEYLNDCEFWFMQSRPLIKILSMFMSPLKG